MNREKLNTLILETERFLEKARTLQDELSKTYTIAGSKFEHEPNCPKESGAVRRASLDLSRALSEYRRY